MKKGLPYIAHPIIDNILLTGFSIFILIGGLFAISRNFTILMGEGMTDVDVTTIASESAMWFGIGFLGYGALYGYECFLWRHEKKVLLFSALCAVSFLAFGVLNIILRNNKVLIFISGIGFFAMLAIRRVAIILADRSKRNIILNGLLILFLLICILLCSTSMDTIYLVPILVGIFWVVLSLFFICGSAFKRMRLKVLMKIVRKTYAAEIFIGMLSMIAAFSVVFYYLDPKFATIGDALWYSFAVVTTIGFGDFYATTLITRLLSVILGMYGLIVVAVITSIIVNFYSETKGSPDEDEEKKEQIEDKPEEKQDAPGQDENQNEEQPETKNEE